MKMHVDNKMVTVQIPFNHRRHGFVKIIRAQRLFMHWVKRGKSVPWLCRAIGLTIEYDVNNPFENLLITDNTTIEYTHHPTDGWYAARRREVRIMFLKENPDHYK